MHVVVTVVADSHEVVEVVEVSTRSRWMEVMHLGDGCSTTPLANRVGELSDVCRSYFPPLGASAPLGIVATAFDPRPIPTKEKGRVDVAAVP